MLSKAWILVLTIDNCNNDHISNSIENIVQKIVDGCKVDNRITRATITV